MGKASVLAAVHCVALHALWNDTLEIYSGVVVAILNLIWPFELLVTTSYPQNKYFQPFLLLRTSLESGDSKISAKEVQLV